MHPDFIRRSSSPSDMHCFMPLVYQMALETSMRHPGCLFVELGVRTGNSAIALLAAIADANTNSHLNSCDIDLCSGFCSSIPADLLPYWSFAQTDSVAFSDSFPEHSIQFLFIDTDHSYTLTAAELSAWNTRLATGARILLHDTCSVPDGVGRAIAEYLSRYTNSTYYNIDAYAGLGVITKP